MKTIFFFFFFFFFFNRALIVVVCRVSGWQHGEEGASVPDLLLHREKLPEGSAAGILPGGDGGLQHRLRQPPRSVQPRQRGGKFTRETTAGCLYSPVLVHTLVEDVCYMLAVHVQVVSRRGRARLLYATVRRACPSLNAPSYFQSREVRSRYHSFGGCVFLCGCWREDVGA